MGFQFFRYEAYGRKGSSRTTKGKTKTKLSVAEVAAEAGRVAGHCDHVKDPQPPKQLFGCSVFELEAMCESYAKTVKDGAGKKLRSDAPTLLAGVISCGAHDADLWEKHKALSLEFLKKKYGERLKCVLEHNDEEHPHMHFYVIPNDGEAFENVHEGRAAAATFKQGIKDGTATKKQECNAYRAAMRGVQDEFFKGVSIESGLLRLGPGRRRQERAEYMADQQAARAVADALEVVAQATETSRSEFLERKATLDALKETAEAAAAQSVAAHDAAKVTIQKAESLDIAEDKLKLGADRGAEKRRKWVAAQIETHKNFFSKVPAEIVLKLCEKIEKLATEAARARYEPLMRLLGDALQIKKLGDFYKKQIAALTTENTELQKENTRLARLDGLFSDAEIEKAEDKRERAAIEQFKPAGYDFRANLAAAKEAKAAADAAKAAAEAAKPKMPPAGQQNPLAGLGKGGVVVQIDEDEGLDPQFM